MITPDGSLSTQEFVNHNVFSSQAVKMYFLVLAIATVLTPVFGEKVALGGWIAGGENALIESYPYQASLEYLGRHICGASIIRKDIVLTAAHCVNNSKPVDLEIRAGSSLVGQGGSMYQVDRVVIHNMFNKTGHAYVNDIALLWLKEHIEFDEKRKDIRMFLVRQKPKIGEEAKVTGWGNSFKTRQQQLQVVTLKILNDTICKEAYQESGVSDYQICAGESGKGSCWGDDGGPLAVDGKLAGIVSWGDSCDKEARPGVYTSIGFVREWIDDVMLQS